MVNLYTHQASNVRKTWLLMAVFLVLVIFLGFIFSVYFQSSEILYFAIGFSLLMNLIAFWNSDKIALSLAGAKPITREQNSYLWNMVENLCITAGLPMPRVYIIPSEQINAFATGRNPKNAAVAVTTGAIERLENEELEGVLAHELAHIGNRDILVATVVVVLAGIISMLADWFLRAQWFGGDDNHKGNAVVLVIGIAAAILAPIAAMLIQLAISRKREFLADATGALLTRYPDGLANALEKIGHDHASMSQAKTATAHLYISNPFRGQRGASWIAKLFSTHPPVEERIRILRGIRV